MSILWFRIIEKYQLVESSVKKGRTSTEHLPSRLCERHFVDYIPSTEKKTNPIRQCIICCSKRDSKALSVVLLNSWDAKLAISNDPRYARLETNLGIVQAKEG
ncbi:hypothetical protein TNCV_278111 [Trichonephila clavipes]|nr:hypothetical protein TNCV_278111 [Trichonephila clavipes]